MYSPLLLHLSHAGTVLGRSQELRAQSGSPKYLRSHWLPPRVHINTTVGGERGLELPSTCVECRCPIWYPHRSCPGGTLFCQMYLWSWLIPLRPRPCGACSRWRICRVRNWQRGSEVGFWHSHAGFRGLHPVWPWRQSSAASMKSCDGAE